MRPRPAKRAFTPVFDGLCGERAQRLALRAKDPSAGDVDINRSRVDFQIATRHGDKSRTPPSRRSRVMWCKTKMAIAALLISGISVALIDVASAESAQKGARAPKWGDPGYYQGWV